MKKLLLTLLLLCSIITCSATNFIATGFSYKDSSTSYQWTDWSKCNIRVFASDDTNHIEIYSQNPQVIDFGELKETKTSEYTAYTGSATDTNYKQINISFILWNNGGKSIIIEYDDIAYTYQVEQQ